MKIAVFGANGYTGSNLTEEALRRGHTVVAVSRSGNADDRPGVSVRKGTLHNPELIAEVSAEVDVIAVAIPAVTSDGSLIDAVPMLLNAAATSRTRLAFVGGAGSLLTSPGGEAVYDAPEFPDAYRQGSRAQGAVLAALRSAQSEADWFYLSPAGDYGKRSPGERTGSFRLGTDVLVTDASGTSFISGADYAIAFLDEIETPKHSRARFTVAY